jgi:hypothetical protein
MKADEAPIALSGEEAASSPGCAFFFWGLEIVTRILKKLGFWLGSEVQGGLVPAKPTLTYRNSRISKN